MNDRITSSSRQLPVGLSLEKAAASIASLAATESLRELTSTVLAQWKHTETFAKLAKHGIRPIDRLLFYGPPGNGKTMASQWLAQKIGVPLYRVRCECLVSSYFGATATQVAEVMEWLARQQRCVVLFDEVEQILPSREGHGSSRELGSAMTVFWQFLDRWESQTLFVLATNLPGRLDPALLSRIDMQMEFGPPTVEQSESVIRYWMEALHEHGGDEWGPELLAGDNFESFRALFQAIQQRVRLHVTRAG